MIIQLNKFGTTLVSRQIGKEAYAAIQPELRSIPNTEEIIIDFTGVITFTPSWGDEFLSPMQKRFPNLKLKNTKNPSVKATLKMLETVNNEKFTVEE